MVPKKLDDACPRYCIILRAGSLLAVPPLADSGVPIATADLLAPSIKRKAVFGHAGCRELALYKRQELTDAGWHRLDRYAATTAERAGRLQIVQGP